MQNKIQPVFHLWSLDGSVKDKSSQKFPASLNFLLALLGKTYPKQETKVFMQRNHTPKNIVPHQTLQISSLVLNSLLFPVRLMLFKARVVASIVSTVPDLILVTHLSLVIFAYRLKQW
ncbi:MAG: hypothetical protein VKJ24_14120, partial [Synechococcales bacterium]|nr:hypothetical protein [Synechococcales bacterium]